MYCSKYSRNLLSTFPCKVVFLLLPFIYFFFFYETYKVSSFIKAEAIVFSRSPLCEYTNESTSTVCKDKITGILTLRNNEIATVIGSKVSSEVQKETRVAEEHDPSRNGIKITLTKSDVRFSYDLEYELDVFSEFYEDVHEFSYQQTGKDPAHFCYVTSVEHCQETGNVPRTPEGYQLLFSTGRCCWCASNSLYGTGPYGSGGAASRSANLKCSTVDVLLGKSVWLTKSCPRIRGPWYSGMRIGSWRWDFTVQLQIEWFAPKVLDNPEKDGLFSIKAQQTEQNCLRETQSKENSNVKSNSTQTACLEQRSRVAGMSSTTFTLNFSVPHIYDVEHGVECRITGSLPETDALPPSLENYRLFIPTYPPSDPLVQKAKLQNDCGVGEQTSSQPQQATNLKQQWMDNKNPLKSEINTSTSQNPAECLSTTMLLPKEFYDVSGQRCDVVGTSLHTWANPDGQFCHVPYGKCMSNQLGVLYNEDLKRIARKEKPKYVIGKHSQIGSIGKDPRFRSNDSLIDIKNKTQLFLFSWQYIKEHTTFLQLRLDAEQVMWIASSSPGEIQTITPGRACETLVKGSCETTVTVRNTGSVEARYVVSLPYCVTTGSTKASDEIRPIAPLGLSILPKTSTNFSFYLDTFTLNEKTSYYTCKVALSDAQGRRLDQSLFTIGFNQVKQVYQGAKAPFVSPITNITESSSTNATSENINFFLKKLKLSLRKLKTEPNQFTCECKYWNVLCAMKNFYGCFLRLKTSIVSAVGMFGVAATIYVFGPTLQLLARKTSRICYEIRHQQNEYFRNTMPNLAMKHVDKKPTSRGSKMNTTVAEHLDPSQVNRNESQEHLEDMC